MVQEQWSSDITRTRTRTHEGFLYLAAVIDLFSRRLCAMPGKAMAMHDLLRLARSLRCDPTDPGQVFRHRLGVGIAVAALILILSPLG